MNMTFFLCPLSRYNNWRRTGLRVDLGIFFDSRICETGSLVTLLSTTLRTSCPSTTLASVNRVLPILTSSQHLGLTNVDQLVLRRSDNELSRDFRPGFQLEERLVRLLGSRACASTCGIPVLILIVPSGRFRFLHSLWLL